MRGPYRTGAELVVCRPKRTLWGRLRSWWRRRFVVGKATWRFRFRRLRCGHVDRKRRQIIGGAWVWYPPPRDCVGCRVAAADGEMYRQIDAALKESETPFDEPVKLVNARPPSRPPATPPKRPPPPKRVSE